MKPGSGGAAADDEVFIHFFLAVATTDKEAIQF